MMKEMLLEWDKTIFARVDIAIHTYNGEGYPASILCNLYSFHIYGRLRIYLFVLDLL
jgi:hypothetical protein